MAAVVLAAGLCLTGFFALDFYRQAFERITREIEQSAAFASAQSNEMLNKINLAVTTVSLWVKDTGAVADVEEFFEVFRRVMPTLRTLSVVGPDGVVVADSRLGRKAVGIDVSDRQYFIEAAAADTDRLILGESVISRVDRIRAFPMSKAVRTDDGALLGVVVTSVDASFFSIIRRVTSRIGGGEIVLADPGYGNVSALFDPGLSDAKLAALETALGNEAFLARAAEGVASLQTGGLHISASKLAGFSIYALDIRALSAIAAEARQATAGPLLLGVLLSLAGAAVVWLVTRFEQTSSRTAKRYAHTAANIPGAILQYALEPDGTDRVDYISEGCLDLYELTPAQIGKDAAALSRMIHQEDQPACRASIERSARTLEPWTEKLRIITPSGQLKTLQGRGIPERRASGEVVWSTLILDVSALEAARAEADQNRRMLLAAQKRHAIGDLTGGVAHDFNNLLSIIKGNLELVDRRELGPDAEELLEEVRVATQRSIDIARSLSLFGRSAVLEPKVISLNDPVAELERLLRRTFPENITINCIFAGGLWRTKIDPNHLQTALLNLALNARDAMPSGGILTIETSNVRLEEGYVAERDETITPGRYVMVAVTDTGEGIDPDTIDRVFDPYFTTKSRTEGTGLGLSMVDGYLKQSGGTARIYSEPGQGTAVKLYFPAYGIGFSDIPPVRDSAEVQEGDEVVLVVEDDEQVRRTVIRQLGSLGYTVMEAANGDDALKIIREGKQVDAILTDVILPGSFLGPRLLEEIRKHRPNIPAILMSGYPEEAAIHGTHVNPKDLQLTKPVALADLGRGLRRQLNRARQKAQDRGQE